MKLIRSYEYFTYVLTVPGRHIINEEDYHVLLVFRRYPGTHCDQKALLHFTYVPAVPGYIYHQTNYLTLV